MNKLLLLLLALPTAASATTLTCSTGSSSVEISRNNYGDVGRLMHNYNGASLSCEFDAVRRLVEDGQPIRCVGLWHAAFDQGGKLISKIAEVQFTKRPFDGVVVSSFVVDWDGRDAGSRQIVTANCKQN